MSLPLLPGLPGLPGLAAAPSKGVSFNVFLDFSLTSGGTGTWADPYSPAAMTALGSLPESTRVGFIGSVADGAHNPRVNVSGDGLLFGQAGDTASVISLFKAITGTWTQPDVGTHPNVWQITVSQPSNAKMSGNIKHNGALALLVIDRAALTSGAVEGAYYVDVWGWQGTRSITATTSLVIETYSTTNPNSDGIAREYSAYLNLFDLGGEGCTVRDIDVEGAGHQDGNIRMTGVLGRLKSSIIRNGSRHGSLFGAFPTIEDVQYLGGRNRQEGGGGDHAVVNQDNFGASDTATLRRVTFDAQATENGLSLASDNISAFQAHDTSNDKLATVTVENCTFRDGICGFIRSGTVINITNPVFDGAKRLISEFPGDATFNVEGATGSIGHVWKTNASSGTQTLNTEGMDIEIESSLVSDTVKAVAWSQNEGLTANWVSQSDTVVHPTASGSRQLGNLRKGKVTCYDGQFAGTTQLQSAFQIAGYSGGTGGEFEGDRNTYKTGVTFQINGDTSLNFATWQSTVSPQDANSITA